MLRMCVRGVGWDYLFCVVDLMGDCVVMGQQSNCLLIC